MCCESGLKTQPRPNNSATMRTVSHLADTCGLAAFRDYFSPPTKTLTGQFWDSFLEPLRFVVIRDGDRVSAAALNMTSDRGP